MSFFWFLYICYHRLVKHLIKYFLNLQSQPKQLYIFRNSFASSIKKDIDLLFLFLSPSSTLNVLIYPLILGIIKSNGVIALSKYQIQNLELVFVLTNFEITMFTILTSQFLQVFLQHKTFLLLFLSLQISALLYYEKNCDYFLAN